MSAVRTLWNTVFGAVLGLALGIAAPLALFALMYWGNPDRMRYGGATPFALLLPFSAIAGAGLGAALGFARGRSQSNARFASNSPGDWLVEFRERFATYSLEDQRVALAEILPQRLAHHKQRMWTSLVFFTAAGLLSLVEGSLGEIVLAVIVVVTLSRIVRMRTVLANVRREWGDDALASIEPLPLWLRPLSTRNDWQG